MAIEDIGELVDGSQPNVIPRCAVQPDHHVLDHGSYLDFEFERLDHVHRQQDRVDRNNAERVKLAGLSAN
jgi:hypothetical protein